MPRNRFRQIQAQLRQFLLLDLYWSYSQLNHLTLNMVHRETLVAHAMLEGKKSKGT